MTEFRQVYSLDNDVFKKYAFYSTLLALKMFGVILVTIYRRFTKFPRVFTSPEDASLFNGKVGTDSDIERVRRAHLNDLENIVPFWALGLLFVATNPSYLTAVLCFRIFTASRIAHSFIYILGVPQPARAISFLLGVLVNLFMAFTVITNAF